MSTADLIARNDAALGEISQLLALLTPSQYCQIDDVVQGCIGTHVRHCIEFYDCLLLDSPNGEICYHTRPRQTALETDLTAARDRLSGLCAQLRSLPEPGRSLRVTHFGGTVSDSCTVRELCYVLDHTVHHTALMRVIATHLNVHLDAGFGFSASTLANRQSAG